MILLRTQARLFTAADALLELMPPKGLDVIPEEVLAGDPVYVYAGTGKVFTRPELIRALRFLARLGVIPTPVPSTADSPSHSAYSADGPGDWGFPGGGDNQLAH